VKVDTEIQDDFDSRTGLLDACKTQDQGCATERLCTCVELR
jgi:hypothetical protein